MPNHRNGTTSHQPTMEEIQESIRQLQMELNSYRCPCTEQSTHSLINPSVPLPPAVSTSPSSILANISALPISTFDVIHTVHSEDAHLATFYDNVIYHATNICMSQISASKAKMLASYYCHESNIASSDSFFYSNASTLFRLGIG